MRFQTWSIPEVSINIAPLVDVVFLLVIFFAVSTTFLDDTTALELELPSSTSTTQRELQAITVLLTADGIVKLGDRELGRDELASQLREMLERAEEKIVVLKADTNATHGEVIHIIDLIRAAGAKSLTLATRSGPGE